MRLDLTLLGAAIGAALATSAAQAASFTPPKPSPAIEAERKQLGDTILNQPGVQLPDDRAELDAALAARDWGRLVTAINGVPSLDAANKMADWERYQVYRGGGYNVVFMYVRTLSDMAASYERAALKNPDYAEAGKGLRMAALSQLLYLQAIIKVDGVRCADATAPVAQRDRIMEASAPFMQAGLALEREALVTALTAAAQQERLTAKVRDADPDLCRGGLEEIGDTLKKYPDRARAAGKVAGRPGTTIDVPVDFSRPAHYSAPKTWDAKREQARIGLEDMLGGMVGLTRAKAP